MQALQGEEVTAWGGKKNATTKKTTQKKSQKTTQKKSATTQKKKSQKVTPQIRRTYPANKSYKESSQKKSQKIVAEILPGDLVSVERVELGIYQQDYTGSILGVVMKVDNIGNVTTNWTANTSDLPEWDLPECAHYMTNQRHCIRFKVLSRKCEWKVAS